MSAFAPRLSRLQSLQRLQGLHRVPRVAPLPHTACASARTAVVAAGLACLTALTPAAHARGVVEVSFVEPERFTDIGWRPADRERNLEVLARRLRDKAERLPDGQTLKVEVLDVDLAGAEFVLMRNPEIRVLKGRADWPRMQLRYTLSAQGRTLRSGQEQVQDMAYMERSAGLPHTDALAYDLRLLDEWFERRVIRAESP